MEHLMMRGFAFMFVLALTSGAKAFAQRDAAQGYPAKPIRFIVPLAPGGGTDIIARVIAGKITDAWAHPVVTDNRAGAAGNIAAEIVARATPDGYTLLLVYTGHAINAALYAKLRYDLVRDLAPVTQATMQTYALVVHPSVPVKSISELIVLARAKPGSLNYGSSGTGGFSHLTGALFTSLAGIDIVHVPYKGGALALTDVIGGQIQMMFSTLLQAQTQIKAGKLRAVAVTSGKRSRAAPDLPTVQESGVPGYEVTGWYGVSAPAKTPPSIIEKLNKETVRLLHTAEVADKLAAAGFDPVGNTPEQFGAHIRSEIGKWAKAIKDANIRVE